ncbi:MAG: HAD-IIIA family hydrolase [Pseudomonadota bacterium]
MENVKQAAILIGGMGTRLGEAVRDTPKPLLEVCNRPFVEHLMLNLRRFGFHDFLLLAGYRAEVVQQRYGPNSDFVAELDADVTVLVEPGPLGTAGALKFAAAHLQDQFLLLNGDSIFDFNYLDLCLADLPEEPREWVVRMALLPVTSATRYGFVSVDGNRVSAFSEKPSQPRSGLINSGVYLVNKRVLNHIEGAPSSLEQDVFPALAESGLLFAKPYRGFFIDIGIPEDLERARTQLLSELTRPAAFLDRDGTLNYDAGYTHRIDGFQWLPGAKDAIKALNDAGYFVFVVTNQAGIARGYYNHDDVDSLHQWMRNELAGSGAHIDDFRFCPHHPEGRVPEFAIACQWRKPEPGMLVSLIKQWQPRLQESFMLGDSDKDVQAAAAAGISGHLIAPGELLPTVLELLSRTTEK